MTRLPFLTFKYHNPLSHSPFRSATKREVGHNRDLKGLWAKSWVLSFSNILTWWSVCDLCDEKVTNQILWKRGAPATVKKIYKIHKYFCFVCFKNQYRYREVFKLSLAIFSIKRLQIRSFGREALLPRSHASCAHETSSLSPTSIRQCHRLTICFFISDLTNSDKYKNIWQSGTIVRPPVSHLPR